MWGASWAVAANRGGLAAQPVRRFAAPGRAARRWHQANPEAAAAVKPHHYDLSTEPYRLFPTTSRIIPVRYSNIRRPIPWSRHSSGNWSARQPSSVYARADSSRDRPGRGAFAIHIAATTGARVTAVNVSPEQPVLPVSTPMLPGGRSGRVSRADYRRSKVGSTAWFPLA
jgi:hypothetical protein